MDKDKMLKKMCRVELTQADIKAICKLRALPPACLQSRTLLEHHFLSDTGIEKALAALDSREVLCLHLLNAAGREEDIEFFTRLYKKAHPGSYHHTFTEQYRTVFSTVKAQLVRKGVLLFAEAPNDPWQKTVKLERLRFMFPVEFAAFLPPPVKPLQVATSGVNIERIDFLRQKLAEIIETPSVSPSQTPGKEERLHIRGQTLFLGKSPFSVKRLRGWIGSRWRKVVEVDPEPDNSSLSPVDLIEYAFSLLGENQWAEADELSSFFKIAYPSANKLPDVRKACEKGWQNGCLEKLSLDGKAVYRLAAPDPDHDLLNPAAYVVVKTDEFFEIDLKRIPFEALESICKTCKLQVSQKKLVAQPDLVRISYATKQMALSPVLSWLQKYHKRFGQIVATIRKREGKTIVHDNLMIAAVKDLSLRVLLEKKFSNSKQVVTLSDEFISFPLNLLPEIEKIVNKSGHAVKYVDADE
ncbi:hypothetical protein JY97_14430 [Alkalispirochaeta odontotermitis]|nr:hypothetical protein JY97_14430 [Alkalispirochaeta odontotermitis]